MQVKDGFCMYPEERLGMHANSASMMWERVEAVFEGVRSIMRDNGRARSGTMSMEWSVSFHEFWKVRTRIGGVLLMNPCNKILVVRVCYV